MLEFFHLLTFDSKASVFEFYRTLTRRSDNTGTFHIPVQSLFPLLQKYQYAYHGLQDRYDEFLRMIRQWRNLKMVKRAGRGHCSEGVAGTKEGECAVLCPACPQPARLGERPGEHSVSITAHI